jgi:single-stranded DNA-binding protein
VSDINTTVLAGRCTKDAQERKGGVVIISLACNRARKTDTGFEQDVLYMDVVVLGGLGKRAAKLKKGDALTCSGRLEMNVWNHDDGTTRRSIRLVANEITAERFFHKADDGQESIPFTDELAAATA